MTETLIIRKLADQDAEREKVFHPITGQPILFEPDEATAALIATLRETVEGIEVSPRPFEGVRVEGDPPQKTTMGERLVACGRAEGWIDVEGETIVYRTSGPPENPYGPPPHQFLHFDTIIIKTVDGDLRYKVLENPDKWPDTKDGEAGFGGEVRWFYEVELEESE